MKKQGQWIKRERQIVQRRENGETYGQIGDYYQVTASRIRDIYLRAKRRTRIKAEYRRRGWWPLPVKAGNVLMVAKIMNRMDLIHAIERGRFRVGKIPGLGPKTFDDICKHFRVRPPSIPKICGVCGRLP